MQCNMLAEEAAAFDAQIRERIAHGHIPDLRRVEPCEWFRNNVWRRPYLVEMRFGRVFRFIQRHLPKPGSRVLEVGCGPGFLSLEMARHGHDVLGIDLSAGALEVAERLARENPYREQWGGLQYRQVDFLAPDADLEGPFDAVLFSGALHHFSSPAAVLDEVLTILHADGRVIVHEPTRDAWTSREASLLAFTRLLLSGLGNWFEDLELPQDAQSMERITRDCLLEVREARTKSEDLQSVMDNASAGGDMIDALNDRFEVIAEEPGTLLFDRVAAGIRGVPEERAEQLARFLQVFESFALEQQLIRPGWMLFAGRIPRPE